MTYTKQTAVFIFGLFLFFGAGNTGGLRAQEAASGGAAFFRDIRGTVETKAPGEAVWVKAAEGDRIENNTLISTGFNSTAVLVLGDSVLALHPVTRLSLEEIIRDGDGEQVRLYLRTGRIRADVKPPAGLNTDFTVRSPVVTASVRGTAFEFDAENLRVEEGRVVYSLANGRETSVAAGDTSYVDEPGGTLIRPFEAAAELLSPALPVGSGSTGRAGDNAPAIPRPEGGVGLGFGWD
jgi:hypothetical protein